VLAGDTDNRGRDEGEREGIDKGRPYEGVYTLVKLKKL